MWASSHPMDTAAITPELIKAIGEISISAAIFILLYTWGPKAGKALLDRDDAERSLRRDDSVQREKIAREDAQQRERLIMVFVEQQKADRQLMATEMREQRKQCSDDTQRVLAQLITECKDLRESINDGQQKLVAEIHELECSVPNRRRAT